MPGSNDRGGPVADPPDHVPDRRGRDLREVILHQLAGYRGSRPVRIGNAAAEQHQLDIYDEVLWAAYLHFHRHGDERQAGKTSAGPRASTPTPEVWTMLRELVRQAASDGRNWTAASGRCAAGRSTSSTRSSCVRLRSIAASALPASMAWMLHSTAGARRARRSGRRF